MKYILCFAIAVAAHYSVHAQKTTTATYAQIDKAALQIPDSMTRSTDGIARYMTSQFNDESDRVRAIFVWIASNIAYDTEAMYAIIFSEGSAERAAKALASRRGTCANYAALFDEICRKAGITSCQIEGYVKQKGSADFYAHAWCAAVLKDQWRMFDPTWGAGYVTAGKFYKKLNNEWYMAAPSSFIMTHAPFDPMWQMLDRPLTSDDFAKGRIVAPDSARPYLNYDDSIAVYEKQDTLSRLIAASRRIEANGVTNNQIYERLKSIKYEIEVRQQNERNKQLQAAADMISAAGTDYNDGVRLLNAFIAYRNNRFLPAKPDIEIQAMLETVSVKFSSAKTRLSSVTQTDSGISMTANHSCCRDNITEASPMAL